MTKHMDVRQVRHRHSRHSLVNNLFKCFIIGKIPGSLFNIVIVNHCELFKRLTANCLTSKIVIFLTLETGLYSNNAFP